MQMRSMCSIGEGAFESGVELLLLEFEAEKRKNRDARARVAGITTTLGQTSEGSELMAIGLLFNQTVICSMHTRVVSGIW